MKHESKVDNKSYSIFSANDMDEVWDKANKMEEPIGHGNVYRSDLHFSAF